MPRCAGQTKAERSLQRVEDSYVRNTVKKLDVEDRLKALRVAQRQAASKLAVIKKMCTNKQRRSSALAANVAFKAVKKHRVAAHAAREQRRASLNASRLADGSEALQKLLSAGKLKL